MVIGGLAGGAHGSSYPTLRPRHRLRPRPAEPRAPRRRAPGARRGVARTPRGVAVHARRGHAASRRALHVLDALRPARHPRPTRRRAALRGAEGRCEARGGSGPVGRGRLAGSPDRDEGGRRTAEGQADGDGVPHALGRARARPASEAAARPAPAPCSCSAARRSGSPSSRPRSVRRSTAPPRASRWPRRPAGSSAASARTGATRTGTTASRIASRRTTTSRGTRA